MSHFNADFLRYGDVIQHIIDGVVPGEKFMVVKVKGDLLWAINLWEWADTPAFDVVRWDTSMQNFRIVEAKGTR